MSNLLEVRWHGRGGQGTVTGAKTLAEVILTVGKYIQAFPEYGPERRGAPVRVFNRFSDDPIRVHTPVKTPRVVMIVDPTLVGNVNLTEGAREDATFIVNTVEPAAVIRERLGLAPAQKLLTLDATGISIQEIGRALPNTPMIGAFMKTNPILGLETLLAETRKSLEGKFPAKVVDGNIAAVQRGYEEVKSDA